MATSRENAWLPGAPDVAPPPGGAACNARAGYLRLFAVADHSTGGRSPTSTALGDFETVRARRAATVADVAESGPVRAAGSLPGPETGPASRNPEPSGFAPAAAALGFAAAASDTTSTSHASSAQPATESRRAAATSADGGRSTGPRRRLRLDRSRLGRHGRRLGRWQRGRRRLIGSGSTASTAARASGLATTELARTEGASACARTALPREPLIEGLVLAALRLS